MNLNPLGPLYRFADWLRYRKERNLGKRGEDLAHRYLRSRGFTIAARNWRPPQGGGEIDLIAWDKTSEGDALVFVEVKTRASGQWNAPERAINNEKIQALRRAARDYVRRCGADPARVRFDAISISGGRVEHLREAFARDLSVY